MPKITVQPGSNLFQLARGTGYTPEQLAAYNMIEDPNQIRVGQDIFIPYSRQEFESFAGPMTQPVQATTPVQSTATQPVVQTRQAQVVDPTKVYTYSELTKTPGAMYQRDAAVKEVESRLGRKLSVGEATLVSDEGFVTVPYKDLDKTAIGMGQQGKYYTPDNILEGFELAITDKKEQMKAKFGKAYPKDEKKEWALINLAYRGDVQPGWSSKFKAGDIQEAEKEFWNNDSYRKLLQKEKQGKPTELLNRLRRNAKDLFGFSSF